MMKQRLVSGVWHEVVDDARCPKCRSRDYASVPGVWRRAICPHCESVYIRLTGCEAFRHRNTTNMSDKLTAMELLTLSNLAHQPQRFLAAADPLRHLEVLGLIVPLEGSEWKLYQITEEGRKALLEGEGGQP